MSAGMQASGAARGAGSIAAACALLALAAMTITVPVLAGQAPDFHAITYHDVTEAASGDDPYAVSAAHLAQHFEWLRKEGYAVVGLDDILAATRGGPALPAKPVLLTFDDGMRSTYTRAFPLLKLFGYRAVVSIVTDWVETAQPVADNDRMLTREDFLTWDQLREMQRSGLVEIASHTNDLHAGVPGNPSGSLQPAATTRIYANGAYEDDASFMLRIEDDLGQSANAIREHTGRAPRAVTWPYGAWTRTGQQTAARLGMGVSLVLGASRLEGGDSGVVIGRDMALRNPRVTEFAAMFAADSRPAPIRAAWLELDKLYDSDPSRQESRLTAAVEAVRSTATTHVLLTAYADSDGDGRVDGLYFPNGELPMRADLFNRAAWQLAKRAGARVIASLPLTAYPSSWADDRAAAERAIRRIYADLARYASFDGIHFAGAGDTTTTFAMELADAVRRDRPEVLIVRSWPLPGRQPDDSALAGLLANYDYVLATISPLPSDTALARESCHRLASAVDGRTEAMQKLIAVLPAPADGPDAAAGRMLGRLTACGVRHVAWLGQPARASISDSDHPRQLMSAADAPRSR